MKVRVDFRVAERTKYVDSLSLFGIRESSEIFLILLALESEDLFKPPHGLEFLGKFFNHAYHWEFAVEDPPVFCQLESCFTTIYAKNLDCSLQLLVNGTNLEEFENSQNSIFYVSGLISSSYAPHKQRNTTCGVFPKHLPLAECIEKLRANDSNSFARVPWAVCPVVQTAKNLNLGQVFQIPERATPPITEMGVTCMNGVEFFHYKCDGFDDVGWGCAYRSVQMVCAWWSENFGIVKVPSILDIQGTLNQIEGKVIVGSKAWIGCVEAGLVLSELSQNSIECRILHVTDKLELKNMIQTIVRKHILLVGSPIIVGAGDFAYVIAGVSDQSLLIMDPHISKPPAQWRNFDQFFDPKKMWSAGFINLCLSRLVV